MTGKQKRLADAFPKNDITMMEVYFIENDAPLVPARYIERILGVTRQSLHLWEKKGMAECPWSIPRLRLYDINYVKKWHRENIDQKQSRNSIGGEVNPPLDIEDNPYLNMDLDKVPQAEADRRKAIESVKRLQKQNAILKEEYVAVDDIDRTMAAMGAMFIASLSNLEKSAPSMLANKPKDEIVTLLEDAHQGITDKLHELVQKEFDGDDDFYAVMETVMDHLHNGKSPELLIKRMGK